MKRALQDVVFASEKRKNILMILQEGSQNIEKLLTLLDTSRQSLLPQIKILKEHHLIDQDDDIYELTTIGKLVVDETSSAIELMGFLDADIDYWGTRNLDFIPSLLLNRIRELGNCKIVNPTLTELHEMDKEFYRAAQESEAMYGITSYFHPNFQELFNAMSEKRLKVDFIVCKDLLDKLQTDGFKDFEDLLENELFTFSVYEGKLNFMSFMFHDNHLMMHLLNKTGDFDNRYILCENGKAIKWANELFEYYKQNSKPVKSVKEEVSQIQ